MGDYILDKSELVQYGNGYGYETYNASIEGEIDGDITFEIKLLMGTLLLCSFCVKCLSVCDICKRIDQYIVNKKIDKNLKEYLDKDILRKQLADCSICLETYKETDKLVQLNCNHIFHKDCIKTWVSLPSNNCPLCRLPL